MKVRIIGTNAQIKSDIKVEEIKLLKKYCPEALTLKDENGNAVFKVDYCKVSGSFGQYGICFNEKTKKGYAAISLNTPCDGPSDVKKTEMVTVLAPIAPQLEAITEQIANVVKDVEKINAELKECIEVIDDDEEDD